MSGLLSVCPWVHVELSKRNAWILCIWSSHMRSIHLSTYADVYRESYLLCDCIFPWVKAKWWEWNTRCHFLACWIRLNKWTFDRSECLDRECKCDNRDESFHNWKVKVNILPSTQTPLSFISCKNKTECRNFSEPDRVRIERRRNPDDESGWG